MKMNVEFDCTPEEARCFLGLPDVAPLNAQLVEEMRSRMSANLGMLDPEALMKNWSALGGQAQDQFRRLMTAAASAAMNAGKTTDR